MTVRDKDFLLWDMQRFIEAKLLRRGFVGPQGTTTTEQRREWQRRTIITADIADQIIGKRRGGQVETYREFFQRVYGQPLEGIVQQQLPL